MRLSISILIAVAGINCAMSQSFNPSAEIKSARAVVVDQDGVEHHTRIKEEMLPELVRMCFPGKPTNRKPTGPAIGAIAFYQQDETLVRVRFYDSGNNVLMYDVNRRYYQSEPIGKGKKPSDPKKANDPSTEASIASGLRNRLLGVIEASTPSPHAPVFYDITELNFRARLVAGSYIGRIAAFDPRQESITYQLIPDPESPVDGAITVDKDTGDLYIGNLSKLQNRKSIRLTIEATNQSGLKAKRTIHIKP